MLVWGIKYGNEDNVKQKVICSKEIKIRRYKLEEGEITFSCKDMRGGDI